MLHAMYLCLQVWGAIVQRLGRFSHHVGKEGGGVRRAVHVMSEVREYLEVRYMKYMWKCGT